MILHSRRSTAYPRESRPTDLMAERRRPRRFCSQSSVKGERDAKQLGHGMETMPLHAVPRALGGQFRAR